MAVGLVGALVGDPWASARRRRRRPWPGAAWARPCGCATPTGAAWRHAPARPGPRPWPATPDAHPPGTLADLDLAQVADPQARHERWQQLVRDACQLGEAAGSVAGAVRPLHLDDIPHRSDLLVERWLAGRVGPVAVVPGVAAAVVPRPRRRRPGVAGSPSRRGVRAGAEQLPQAVADTLSGARWARRRAHQLDRPDLRGICDSAPRPGPPDRAPASRSRCRTRASRSAMAVRSGSSWAPAAGSGTTSSTTPRASWSPAVRRIATAACWAASGVRHRMLAQPSGEMTE